MTLRAGSSLGPTLELGTHEEQQSRALSWTCPQAGLSIDHKFSVPIHVLSSLVLPGLQTVPAITVAARPWVPYLSARPSAAPHSMKLSVPRSVSSPSHQGTMFYWGLEPGSESCVSTICQTYISPCTSFSITPPIYKHHVTTHQDMQSHYQVFQDSPQAVISHTP